MLSFLVNHILPHGILRKELRSTPCARLRIGKDLFDVFAHTFNLTFNHLDDIVFLRFCGEVAEGDGPILLVFSLGSFALRLTKTFSTSCCGTKPFSSSAIVPCQTWKFAGHRLLDKFRNALGFHLFQLDLHAHKFLLKGTRVRSHLLDACVRRLRHGLHLHLELVETTFELLLLVHRCCLNLLRQEAGHCKLRRI